MSALLQPLPATPLPLTSVTLPVLQLSSITESAEMQPFVQGYRHQLLQEAQAVLEDYANAVNFERGQLNPDQHHDNPDDKAATYSLTNVVPQAPGFRTGPWNDYKEKIRQRLNNYCGGMAYVVTGITLSGRMTWRDGKPRLAVPTLVWSAYCCPDYDHSAPVNIYHKLPAHAAYTHNIPGSGKVTELSVQNLQNLLKQVTFVDKNFQIFMDDCVHPRGSALCTGTGVNNRAQRHHSGSAPRQTLPTPADLPGICVFSQVC
ncbi:endonuclease domain-containing 1 protein-like [Arapaima gigas]